MEIPNWLASTWNGVKWVGKRATDAYYWTAAWTDDRPHAKVMEEYWDGVKNSGYTAIYAGIPGVVKEEPTLLAKGAWNGATAPFKLVGDAAMEAGVQVGSLNMSFSEREQFLKEYRERVNEEGHFPIFLATATDLYMGLSRSDEDFLRYASRIDTDGRFPTVLQMELRDAPLTTVGLLTAAPGLVKVTDKVGYAVLGGEPQRASMAIENEVFSQIQEQTGISSEKLARGLKDPAILDSNVANTTLDLAKIWVPIWTYHPGDNDQRINAANTAVAKTLLSNLAEKFEKNPQNVVNTLQYLLLDGKGNVPESVEKSPAMGPVVEQLRESIPTEIKKSIPENEMFNFAFASLRRMISTEDGKERVANFLRNLDFNNSPQPLLEGKNANGNSLATLLGKSAGQEFFFNKKWSEHYHAFKGNIFDKDNAGRLTLKENVSPEVKKMVLAIQEQLLPNIPQSEEGKQSETLQEVDRSAYGLAASLFDGILADDKRREAVATFIGDPKNKENVKRLSQSIQGALSDELERNNRGTLRLMKETLFEDHGYGYTVRETVKESPILGPIIQQIQASIPTEVGNSIPEDRLNKYAFLTFAAMTATPEGKKQVGDFIRGIGTKGTKELAQQTDKKGNSFAKICGRAALQTLSYEWGELSPYCELLKNQILEKDASHFLYF